MISESERTVIMNKFFSNVVKTLKFPEWGNLNSNIGNIKDPLLRTILKYKDYQYHCN